MATQPIINDCKERVAFDLMNIIIERMPSAPSNPKEIFKLFRQSLYSVVVPIDPSEKPE